MAGDCGSCAHWARVVEQDEIPLRSIVKAPYDESFRTEEGHFTDYDTREVEATRLYGECRRIYSGSPEVGRDLPVAFTVDASDYDSTLYTQPTFGCVLHEAKNPAT